MYLSSEENSRFTGDVEKNADGKTLEEFVAEYDPSMYQNPSCTADTAVFVYDEDELSDNPKDMTWKLLLIKRANHPCIGMWALPGGFVELGEDTAAAAARELMEETGVEDVMPVQVRSFSNPGRDPRTHIVTTLYAAVVPESSIRPKAGDDAGDAGIFEIKCKKTPFCEDELREEDFLGIFDTEDKTKKNSPYPGYLRSTIRKAPDSVEAEKVELTLTEKERGVVLKAALVRAVEKKRGLKEVLYILKDTDGIAMDHGCVIAYAFEFIKNTFF